MTDDTTERAAEQATERATGRATGQDAAHPIGPSTGHPPSEPAGDEAVSDGMPESASDEPASDESVPGDRPTIVGSVAASRANDELPSSSYLLRVNGDAHQVNDAWVGESLLFVLRSRLGLTGAKDGCGSGDCGACSVLLDDMLVCACLVPAVTAVGREVRTIEGLSAGSLTDVQLALLAAGGVQCGFCTPALTLALHALLAAEPDPDEARIREALVGNMCRCTGYGRVLAAARLVIDRRREADPEGPERADDLLTERTDVAIAEPADALSELRTDLSARVGGLVPRLDAMPLTERTPLGEMTTIEGRGPWHDQPSSPDQPR